MDINEFYKQQSDLLLDVQSDVYNSLRRLEGSPIQIVLGALELIKVRILQMAEEGQEQADAAQKIIEEALSQKGTVQ